MTMMMKQLVTLVLLMTWLTTMTHVLTQAKKEYQPALVHQELRELTLTPEDPIAYFRVYVPKSLESSHIEVLFSACSAGIVRVYYDSCVQGSQGCDDGSDRWYADEDNYFATHCSIVSEEFGLQETQTVGKISNNKPNVQSVHFYGVEMEKGDKNGQVVVQAQLKYYKEGGVAGSVISDYRVNMDLKTRALSWNKLVYCRHAPDTETHYCEEPFVPNPVEYTAYIARVDKSENVNLGTTCGMSRADPKSVRKLVTKAHATNINIDSHVNTNGTYLIGVGAHAPATNTDPEIDYAYRPFTYTVTKENTRSGKDPTLIIVVLMFVLLLAVIGAALAGGLGFYLYKRNAASKSGAYGEFTPLSGSLLSRNGE